MAVNVLELRQKRATLVTEGRTILDRADANGALGAEDQAQYDKLFAQVRSVVETIERAEGQEAEERLLEQHVETRAGGREQPSTENRSQRGAEVEYRIGGGPAAVLRAAPMPENRAAIAKFIRGGLGSMSDIERRALQADIDTQGGYLRPDIEFVAKLILFIKDAVWVRAMATVMAIPNVQSIGVPALDTDPADADWTTELGTGSADTSMAIGKREMRVHPVAKRLLVSNTLIRQTGMPGAIDVEALVRDRLAYKFAITEEKAFMTGTGAQQPLGIFVASALGIDTSRDVSTDNTTTAIAADNLFNVKYTLKPQYRDRPTTSWLFHSDALKQIAKLKNGLGDYLWRPGITMGAPDTLLDIPYRESRYAPNTFTTGLYVGALGDFSFYWILDSLDFQLIRLQELYAATNQTGFIGRAELDAMPVLAEAFVRVKLA